MNWIRALKKETLESFLALSVMWGAREKTDADESKRDLHQTLNQLGVEPSRLWNYEKCLLFKPPSLWYFCYSNLNEWGQFALTKIWANGFQNWPYGIIVLKPRIPSAQFPWIFRISLFLLQVSETKQMPGLYSRFQTLPDACLMFQKSWVLS